MSAEHAELWAIWDGMSAASDEHIAKVRADQQQREEARRQQRATEREAARAEELARVKAEIASDAAYDENANSTRAEGPLCGDISHDSRGHAVPCLLEAGHETDDPTCDAGNGVTWTHYNA